MIEIVLSGLLYSVLFTLLFFVPGGRLNIQIILIAIAYFCFLIILASLNFAYDVIPQKEAAELAYQRHQGTVTRLNENFGVQARVNYFAFLITDRWYAAIGVNVALMSALVLYIKRLHYLYILLFLSPAIVHFSMFSLRDMILSATIFFICRTAMTESSQRNTVLTFILTILLFLQRPELIGVLMASYLLIYYSEFALVSRIGVVAVGLVAPVVLLPYMPMLIGISNSPVSITKIPDLLLLFFESRSGRWVGEKGSNTAMLGGQLASLPFAVRYPLQFFTFFLSPLLPDFKNFNSVVFFVDSVFFCLIFNRFRKVANRRHIIFLLVYIGVNALFIANYGNLFRLRIPCFLIMFSGLLDAHRINGCLDVFGPRLPSQS